MKKYYYSEIEGMVEFYIELQLNPSYDLNTDGVINGNLIEFKKTKSVDGGVSNHKKQLKRYLKAYNSAAKNIPSISYLIYLNSSEYIKINNENGEVISEGEWLNALEFKDEIQNNNKYIKGYIDEYSIIAYNNKFCDEFQNNATKEDIKNEIINPKKLNIIPFDWDYQLNKEKKEKIGWLHFNMNLLGNVLLKKQLGAFFTPLQYVKISTQYIRNAIKRSKEQGYKDYLIIDRCAGTGNLHRLLTADELSHCVLNTLDYTEWTTLKGLYDGRVRQIFPITHNNITENGLLLEGNALTKNFNEQLLKYLSEYNKDTTYIIFVENPPFRDETSTLTSKDKKSRKNKTYIDSLMNNDPIIKGAMKNELSLKFIWSAWNIYNPNEYILYSPIKYWKTNHIFDKKYYGGYITNKKDYNAHYDAGLPIMNWTKENQNNEILKLENGEIHKIHNSIKTLLDKKKYDEYFANMFIQAGEIRPIGTSLDNGNQVVNDTPCRINKNNIFSQLPLWCAAKYNPKFLELNIIMKSGDGKLKYLKDKSFLDNCFIWSCLSQKNKCISNQSKINEMALLQNSKCDKLLKNVEKTDPINKLLNKWKDLLDLVKVTDEYDKKWKYGLSQIEKDINIKVHKGSYNKKNEKVYEFKYPELRDKIKYLKIELKDFYNKEIEPKILKYKLIK